MVLAALEQNSDEPSPPPQHVATRGECFQVQTKGAETRWLTAKTNVVKPVELLEDWRRLKFVDKVT